MGRSPCCAKEGLNRGSWTAMEDKILIDYINTHGEGKWRNLPKRAGLKRCGKSCRLRWLNYLRPDIKRGNITPDEEELIIRLHKLLGNRWSLIAGRLPGRTDNEIKNYWNTNLGKRVNQQKSQANNCTRTNTSSNKHPKKPRNDQKNNKRPSSTNQNVTPTLESNVVRTKAVRCTKVFVNPPQVPQPQPQPQPEPQPQASDDCAISSQPSSMDFMVDDFANVGDFSLISELLNSEFSDVCDFSNESSSNNANDLDLLSPYYSPEPPLVFSQELLEDWLGDQQNMSSIIAN